MNAKWGILVAMTAGAACAAGCGTTGSRAVTRGQSPADAVQQTSHHEACADGTCRSCPDGAYSYGHGAVTSEGCPPGGCQQCGDAGCMACCPWAYNIWPLRKLAESRAAWNNATWTPQHRIHYSYDRPDDLLYPPRHVPPAVKVYPYYTVKGPSDFFMP